MKHIKKKFLQHRRLSKDVQDHLNSVKPDEKAIKSIVDNDFKDYVAHALTEDGSFIQTFKYKRNNKTLFIPEPNPITVYFSNAQMFLKHIIETRELLLNQLEANKEVGDILNSSYSLFGYSTTFITSLFSAIEAFINSQIPSNFEYKRVDRKKTEIYNKEQIQNFIPFDEKIKKVVPQAKDKSFHRHLSHKFEILKEFKALRDKVVHTKANEKSTPNYYEDLFSDLLDFDYLKCIETAKDYINYYEENLIEKCECGSDY